MKISVIFTHFRGNMCIYERVSSIISVTQIGQPKKSAVLFLFEVDLKFI